MQVKPERDGCPIRQRMIGDLLTAHALIAGLGSQEVLAVLAEDFETVRSLAELLDQAREKRRAAIEAMREHLREHGC